MAQSHTSVAQCVKRKEERERVRDGERESMRRQSCRRSAQQGGHRKGTTAPMCSDMSTLLLFFHCHYNQRLIHIFIYTTIISLRWPAVDFHSTVPRYELFHYIAFYPVYICHVSYRITVSDKHICYVGCIFPH